MFYMLILSTLMSIILLMVPLIFFKKVKNTGPIESGFENMIKTSFKSFSINFFNIMVIFVMFDLELIIIMPAVFKVSFIKIFVITNFVLLTLWLEWVSSKIEWKN